MKGEVKVKKRVMLGVWMLSILFLWTIMPALPLVKQAIAAAPVKLEVLVPAGEAIIKPAKLAKRVNSLDGKRIAIHWNGKPGAEYLLAEIEDQLKAKYPNAKFYQWPKGAAWKADVEEFIKKQPVDVAILAVGD
jgi:hypothetical protein